MSMDERGPAPVTGSTGSALDVERDSDVPISTQIFWQLAYQIDSGRLLPGARLPPVRELGAALRVNPNTIRAVYRRLSDAGYVTSRHGAGTHVAERPPAAARERGAGRDGRRDAPPRVARRFHGGRGRRGDLRGRDRAQAPRAPRPRPLRRMHKCRCRLRRRAPGRRVPGHDRGRGRSARRPARPARALPLRPGGHDDLPRRRGPGAGGRAGPGRRDARRARLRRAGPRDRRAARGLAGRSRVRLGSWRGQHPRDARAVGHDRHRDRLRAHRPARRPGAARPHRRRHPDVARGARGRPRRLVLAAGSDPAVDVRLRPVRIWSCSAGRSSTPQRPVRRTARPSPQSRRARRSRPDPTAATGGEPDDADAAVRCFGDARPRLPRPA